MMFSKLRRKILKMIKSVHEPYPIEVKQCEKDNSQECSSRVLVHVGGRLESVGITECCMFFDSVKNRNKNIARCQPGKNYNGTIFAESLVRACKRSYEEDKNVEYVGPICEENKRMIK